MEKKRFIFDIDGTLLKEDYSMEEKFFKEILSKDDAEVFIPKISEYLKNYEDLFSNYDVNSLSEFLSSESGVDITPEIIYKWRSVISNHDSVTFEGVSKTLLYLKGHDYSVVALSNWFADDQIRRLRKANILEYFDNVYGGDFYLKPSEESYLNAAGRFDVKDCIVVGDYLENDVYGPYKVGMDALYFDRKNRNDYNKKLVKSIKRFDELMWRY